MEKIRLICFWKYFYENFLNILDQKYSFKTKMGIFLFILIVRPDANKNCQSHFVLSYWGSNKLLFIFETYFWGPKLFLFVDFNFHSTFFEFGSWKHTKLENMNKQIKINFLEFKKKKKIFWKSKKRTKQKVIFLDGLSQWSYIFCFF